uniref:histone deacetylase n=1 Tax=Ditylum brightwellii TaxID=49249 RepID=A0A7S4UW91_9STRA
MKRRISSNDFLNSRQLKRANSSLFSISTIVEDNQDSHPHPLHERILNHGNDEDALTPPPSDDANREKIFKGNKQHDTVKRSTANNSPSLDDTEVSSSDGFYIDEDDDESNDRFLSPPSTNAVATPSSSNPTQNIITTTAKTASVETEAKVDSDFRTGIVFESGEAHYDRYNKLHKERPLRVTSVRDHLLNGNVGKRCVVLNYCGEKRQCPERDWLEDDDYLRVHLPGYMKRLDRLSNCNCSDRLDREAEQYKSIYFTPDSLAEAKKAATSLCRLVTDVVTNKLDNGFAIIRPPGHHAEPGMAGGYCVINNIAVAAAYAREKMNVKKILIVDWDVHHGNGTQSIFINDADVLYFSVHRYHGGNFFPFLRSSGPNTVGTGEGEGYTMNVGWNSKGMGDNEYLQVWDKILMPIAKEYQPELILVSAGFDAAQDDMGECHVTPDGFAKLTRQLMTLADGKVVCALEGGYVRRVLCNCVENVVKTLLDRNSGKRTAVMEEELSNQDGSLLTRMAGATVTTTTTNMERVINSSAAKSIRDTISAHQKYWKCLQRDDAIG